MPASIPPTEAAAPAAPRRTLRLAGVAAYALLSAAYLTWRAVFTVNPDAPAYAWAFWAFEAYGVLTAVVFFATVADRARRPPRSRASRRHRISPTKPFSK